MLTDLAFNVPPHPADARLFHGLVGSAGRFGPHRIPGAAIRDRPAARALIDQVLPWDFARVMVTHGDGLERGGRDALARAFAFLRP